MKLPAEEIENTGGGGSGISLPSQTGQNGKVLGTDGTNPAWVSPATVDQTYSAGSANPQSGVAVSQAVAAAEAVAGASGRVYATTTAGLAGTTNGQYFWVLGATNALDLYLNSSGSAVSQNRSVPSTSTLISSGKASVGAYIDVTNANLMNPWTIKTGIGIDGNTGAETVVATTYATDFIPVIPGGTMISSSAGSGSNTYPITFFDANKTRIGKISTATAANTVYNVPANAAYARLTFNLTNQPNPHSIAIYVSSGTAALPAVQKSFGAMDAVSVINYAQDVVRGRLPKTINLFNKDAATPNTNLSSAGVIGTSTSSLTEYIPVKAGSILMVSHQTVNPTGYGFVWFDHDKRYISGMTAQPVPGTQYTVPANACYVRFTVQISVLNTLMLIEGTEMPTTYVPFMAVEHKQYKRGKRFGVVGDSQTNANVWQQYVASALNMSLNYQSAADGATYVTRLAAITTGSFTNIDVAVVWLGGNDHSSDRPIGALGDAANAGTFYGDIRAMVEKIYTDNPAIRLMLIAPHWRSTTPNAVGATFVQYVDAIINFGANHGIPVLDLYRKSGSNTYTASTLTSDGKHWNTTGWNNITPMIAEFINTH